MKIYELYYNNINDPTLIDIITYWLYHLSNISYFYNICKYLIYKLDKIKFKNTSGKLIEDVPINLLVKSLDKYNTATNLYRTKAYNVYKIELVNGFKLSCADEHLLFTTYIKNNDIVLGWTKAKDLTLDHFVKTTEGFLKILYIKDLHRKEYMCDFSIKEDDHSYISNGMLSHNTTTTSSFFAWKAIFHSDLNLLITANKEKTSKEVLGKVMLFIKSLPFYMKPGIVSYSKTSILLENGSSIRAVPTTGDSATGDSINCLMIDECALIAPNLIDEFWTSVFPTLSSFSGSQIVVLSTPRGRKGLYYDLWSGAHDINEEGKPRNGFIAKKAYWWEVPGRDKLNANGENIWAKDQISVFGELKFKQEFDLSFDVTESKLIKEHDFIFMNKIKLKFVSVDIYGIPKRVSDKILWRKDFRPDELTYEDKLNRKFVLVIDTAEGHMTEYEEQTEDGMTTKKDPDYNVINIFEVKLLSPYKIKLNRMGYKAVTTKECIYLDLVGIYMDNNFDEEECAKAAQYIAFYVFSTGQGYEGEIDNVRIKFENNFNGHNFENIFVKHDLFYDAILSQFRTTGGNHGKSYFCELGAKLISLRLIVVSQDADVGTLSSIEQLKAFGKLKDKYQGIGSHDDIAITILFASRWFEDVDFLTWIEEWIEDLPKNNYGDELFKRKLRAIYDLQLKYAEDLEDDITDEDFSSTMRAATSGFGLLTNRNSSTYGSLISSPHQRNNQYGNGYMQQGYNQRPMSNMTFGGTRNIVTNTKFIPGIR